MARMRTIKPGFWLNEDLAELSPLTRLLFIGLWGEADREGRLEDRPKRIKAAILPWDDCDPDAMLSELAARGFIRRYAANGRRLIQVVNFVKHQRPHQNENPSELPPPPDPAAHSENGAPHEGLAPKSEAVAPKSEALALERRQEQERRQELEPELERRQERAAAPPSAGADAPPVGPRPEEFQTFWNQHCGAFSRCREMTDARRKKLRTRCRDPGWVAQWQEAILRIARSAFCRGETERGWMADADWFLKPDTMTKVLEGKYDNRDKRPAAAGKYKPGRGQRFDPDAPGPGDGSF